jgi:hypothetical protein
LSTLTVNDGEVTFAGVRNSDGHRVLGVVPKDATAPSLWTDTAPTISALVRIR